MAQGHYDKAAYSMQTALGLARNLVEGPTLISDLVGIAIAGVVLEQVQTMIQQPDAPNLYWC